MKTRSFLLLLFSFFLLKSETCEEKRRAKAENSIFSGKCPLERIDWMKVSKGYDKNRLIALSTAIEAAAKADATEIKKIAEGDASAKFNARLSDSLQKMSEHSVEVSQEFYESYLNHRTVICALFQAAKDPQMRQKPDFVEKSMNAFLKINEDFARVKQDEEKKSLR
jgi:hypothetical protein